MKLQNLIHKVQVNRVGLFTTAIEKGFATIFIMQFGLKFEGNLLYM